MAIISAKTYKIILETNFKALSTFIRKSKFSSCYILCDENTLHHCLPTLVAQCPVLANSEIIEVEAGESSKDIEICTHVWSTLIENKADRNTLMINLGGGVICDLGGFAASCYKRGVAFIHIPTSLLAMADASVGGKNGLDLNDVKNVVGTFSDPAAVFVNPAFLLSLPERHFRNGLAEIYKMALVCSKSFWNDLKGNISTIKMIETSIQLKNKIVYKDPKDHSLRKILNFGHTMGHALELLKLNPKTELLHGEAVVMGMIIEAHLALQKKMLVKSEFTQIVETLCLLQKPVSIPQSSFSKILTLLANDKKSKNQKAQFSLVDTIGSCQTDITVTNQQIKKAITFFNSLVHVGS